MHTTKPIGNASRTPATPRSVFITGASGFIGRALGERYRTLGCDVRGMDLRADASNNVVAGDLRDPKAWSAHAKGCDLFVHTAAVVSNVADWDDYRRTTVQGVRDAMNAAITGGASRFVHYSSVAALGWEFTPNADETHPVVIGPHYRYGVAKGASEHTVMQAHLSGELQCTIVRPVDVYGPGSRAWISEPLKLCRAGVMMLPAGGQGLFSPIYIDDVLDGTMLAAGLEAGCGQIFHLGGGYEVSCLEFFNHHWRWAGRKGSVRCVSNDTALALTGALARINRWLGRVDEASPDSMRMMMRTGGYSIAKAQRVLGYQPKVDFHTGMQRSEAWLRSIGELK